MDDVTVIKLNIGGEETWRYHGRLVRCTQRGAFLEAYFNRDDLPFHGIVMRRGDLFLEVYFSDRWYNLFEIHDHESGQIKGWYANISRPAEFTGREIRYVDLALDLLVYPDGRQLVLDADEFAMLDLDVFARQKAWKALEELKRLVKPEQGFRLTPDLLPE